MSDAFSAKGRFYRGNLHTHSTRSDGGLSPQEVCRRYRDEGYDFLALTDHFIGYFNYPMVDTRPFRCADFTTLIGAELHSGAMENGDLWHILAVGLPFDFEPPTAMSFNPEPGMESGAALARRAREAGGFVAIAHPQWSGLSLGDAMGIDAAHAVEIYNHSCGVEAGRADGASIADRMFSAGRRLGLIATDDAHFHSADHFGGWVMVKAEENDPEALVAALKAGHHYASQGPEIRRIEISDTAVEVECSAAVSVQVQGHGQAARVVHGLSMTRATVPLDQHGTSPWLRVTVVDRAGRRAWSNPYWR
ncbi:MAG: CehA/McbA family metallohydrolase [Paracoccaceae bacterium]